MAAAETQSTRIDPVLAALVADRVDLAALSASPCGTVRGTPRIASDDPTVAGWFQGVMIRPGLTIFLNDTRRDAAHRYHMECSGELKFHFRLTGDSVIGNGALERRVTGGVVGYLTTPACSDKFETIEAGSRARSITMFCARDFLAPMLAAECEGLPDGIADFAGGRDPGFVFGAAPLPLRLRQLVEEMLDPTADRELEGLDALMMEARALELLCAAIRHLTERRDAAGEVSLRDRRRIEALRAILGEEGEASHSLAQLSRMLAWNETQMMESFRKVTGTTIASYRHRLRMDEALRKLRTTDLPITTVAYDAGYGHSGNFATAFRRTFGISPREARNGGH